MKKLLSAICCALLLLMLAGCNKKDSLFDDDSTPQSTSQNTNIIDTSSENPESSATSISLQKISELRGEYESQINNVKNSEYKNLYLTDNFVLQIPDADTLYDLTLTKPASDFKTIYEKFDETFDREFGDIYTEEDKENLYKVIIDNNTYDYDNDSEENYLAYHIDKLMNGDSNFDSIFINTDKAYLAMTQEGICISGLNHDGIKKRAKIDDVFPVMTFAATNYFKIVKNYLNVDSDDKYALLDTELSVKEAVEAAKKIVVENGYSWGDSLDVDVYQVKVLDIGDGKYGFSFTMTPSYKGVKFDSYEFPDDGGFGIRDRKIEHTYELYMPNAFMMESDKFDSFTLGYPARSAIETAEYDSVISFEDAAQMLSENFGKGMDLQVSRAELLYSGMYPVNEDDNSVVAATPVWKFKCHNTTDNLLYFVYINAINGNIEYYMTDWKEI